MERPFSTVNYLKLSDITEEDIKTLEKYKKDLEKFVIGLVLNVLVILKILGILK